MIGKSLSKTDMRRLVNHMGEIEQPWVLYIQAFEIIKTKVTFTELSSWKTHNATSN